MSQKISVMISNYNYASYLPEAIESVLSQTYQNFELIIVDDGSLDNSKEIILKYKENYPDKIKAVLKENGGQASAFNAAFELTTGSIISFLDADDYWYSEKLSVISEYHKSYNAIQHNLLINNQSKFTYLEDKVCKQKRLLEMYGFMGTIPTSGLSFYKDDIKDFFPIPRDSYKICADLYLKIMYLNKGDIFSIDQPLGCYRSHNSNNWFNSQFSSIAYNENTLNHLNEIRLRDGKEKIEKTSEANTIAKVFVDSFALSEEDEYIIFGNGALGTEILRLLKENFNIVAFTNSFVNDEESHLNLPLLPLKSISEKFHKPKLIVASFQITEVLNVLEKMEFDLNSVVTPKL
ncbi:glycosyltransferase family 2 protein [Paenibacillus sp. TH7-28]